MTKSRSEPKNTADGKPFSLFNLRFIYANIGRHHPSQYKRTYTICEQIVYILVGDAATFSLDCSRFFYVRPYQRKEKVIVMVISAEMGIDQLLLAVHGKSMFGPLQGDVIRQERGVLEYAFCLRKLRVDTLPRPPPPPTTIEPINICV